MTGKAPADLAIGVLEAETPAQKIEAALALNEHAVQADELLPSQKPPPDRPTRPAKPELLPPNKMPPTWIRICQNAHRAFAFRRPHRVKRNRLGRRYGRAFQL